MNPPSRRALELCRRFLDVLSRTVRHMSLYSPNHPVAASSVREAWQILHDLFLETGWPTISAGVVAGRWLVNDAVVAESSKEFEVLALSLRGHALRSVTFHSDCKAYEISALCELAGTPAHQAYDTDAADFLQKKGVARIEANLEEFVRAKRVRLPASPLVHSPLGGAVQSPAPPPAPEPAPAPAPTATAQTQSFGTFIKSIVEKAIGDPAERANVYAEALRYVESAVERHVSEATHKLLLEKQGIINERMRTEGVLTTLAKGRVIVDQEGRILMMDEAAEKIAGQKLADVAGKPLLESAAGGERFAALSKELILSENAPAKGQTDVAGAAEDLEALRGSMAVVHDEAGRVVGTFGLMPHAAKFQEAKRQQDEFVANMTHDLKAPLAAICAALELLKSQKPQAAPSEAEFLDISLRNSKVLQQMINELLDFSKLQSGKMTVKPEPCPAAALVQEAARALTPWAQSKKIALSAAAPLDFPLVYADQTRVVQIINNLLSNAIKFTPENGHVDVRVAKGADQRAGFAIFSVRDTGCGISLADQGRIFDRFSQGSTPSREGGVGLGLAIARELVQRHGGEIWVDSEPGQGSTFFFSLPLDGKEA